MYIFSFRSRTQSMKFYDLLRSDGISCKIINTPRSVTGVCGLSVSVDKSKLDSAKKVLGYTNLDTFMGLYSVEDSIIDRQNGNY